MGLTFDNRAWINLYQVNPSKCLQMNSIYQKIICSISKSENTRPAIQKTKKFLKVDTEFYRWFFGRWYLLSGTISKNLTINVGKT